MFQLLFGLILVEMTIVVTLLFRTPIRNLMILGLDQLKRGRIPLVMKTIGGTMFAVLISMVYVINGIKKRSTDSGLINPTDEVLLSQHLLEASLTGFSLFFALIIDRLHYYIREVNVLRKTLEAATKI